MEIDRSILVRTAHFRNLFIAGIILLAIAMIMASYWRFGNVSYSGSPSSNAPLNLLQTGWDYMPGVSPQPDGLHVSYLGREIVQQDGSPGQVNPAVNLYGTYLSATNDFTLSATVKDIKGDASIRLYAEPPIVQDEFRVEPKSLDFIISESTLAIIHWDKYNNQQLLEQKPTNTTTHPIQQGSNHTLKLERQNNNLIVSVDDKQLTVVSYDDYFAENIWFGLSATSQNDSWILATLDVTAASNDSIKLINTQSAAVQPTSATQSLQSIAKTKRPSFLIGATTALGPSVADTSYRTIAYGGNFGSITTENALKWQFIHPQPAIYDFKETDALIDVAKKHNLQVQGHTLVFGEANPKWVQDLPTTTANDKETVKQIMVDHITQTITHFKDRVYAWDVVNEPLAQELSDTSQLRQHKWFDAMGEDYIATAFNAAHQADPNAKLYINDFGLEEDGERWDAILNLVTKLKAQGVPIDGVGFESHVYEVDDEIDPTVLRAHIQQLATIGISSHISEIDVNNDNGIAAQAKQYADVLDVCISEPSCTSWTTWGVSDRYNLYQSDDGTLQSGQDFLWNDQFNPKPAVMQIQNTLKKSS